MPLLRLHPKRWAPLLLACAGASAGSLSGLQAQESLQITNPGFEDQANGWKASKEDEDGKLSTVTAEARHTGEAGLRVKQGDTGPGSWLQSSKAGIAGGKSYRFSFWARAVEPSGVGVWVQFYKEDGKPITLPDPQRAAIQIPQTAKEWTQYDLELQAPADAVSMSCAVHCYSKHACLADFDDFTITLMATAAAEPKSNLPQPKPQPPAAATGVSLLNAERVKEIAAMLDAKPQGIGPSLKDRKTWDALGADATYRDAQIARATRFLDQTLPPGKDAGFNDKRMFRLVTFVLAEGLENKGRFLPAIAAEVAATCDQDSWIVPAHMSYTKFNDLGSAMTVWNLAATDTILGDALPAELRTKIREEARRRVILPYLEELRGLRPTEWWARDLNNWNAVVHGGIGGAALALVDAPEERAEVIAGAEMELPNYIKGFPLDGYSMEGLGYWGYGFGHFTLLAETVFAATHGKVNLFENTHARLVAQFPWRFEMSPGVYAAYADCPFGELPAPWLRYILDQRYGLGVQTPRVVTMDGQFSAFLYSWAVSLSFDPSIGALNKGAGSLISGPRLRDWFENGQVLVARPPEGKTGLTLSFKGGTNGASHGHNDLGTYVVANGPQAILVDPGSMTYDSTTFSAQRYENPINNSYGHDVPRVAGKLQVHGDAHNATVVSKEFTDAKDSVTLDLTKGYDAPDLRKLTRRFDYSREGAGVVTITDEVDLATPQAFGTAVVTFGEAQEEAAGIWLISYKGKKARVEIQANGAPFTVTNEILKNKARAGEVRRLGIDLVQPAAQAKISVKVTPVE